MSRAEGVYEKLSGAWNIYRQIAQEYEDLKAQKAKDDQIHADLVKSLCRALERAQEIILTIGEASGDEAILKEARVYANVIGGLASGIGPEAYDHFADQEIERLLAKMGPRPSPHYSTGPEKARKAATAKKRKKP